MKTKKLFHFLYQGLKLLIWVMVIGFVVDWLRAPSVPEQALQQTLTSVQGKQHTLAQLGQEQVAVVYFWGTWCAICRHTSPAIHRLQQDGMPVLTVAWQSGNNPTLKHYLAQHQWSFESINDPQGQLAQQWQIKVVPTIMILKNGKIHYSTTGLSSYWGLKIRVMLIDWFY